MRICELLEAELPITRDAPGRASTRDYISKIADKKLGGGHFATAYAMPGDVAHVKKIARINNEAWDQDGFYNYLEKIKNLSHFVYLPQILEIQRLESTLGEPYLLVSMERLTGARDMTKDELIIVLEHIIDHELTQEERDDYGHGSLTQTISSLLKSYVRGKPLHEVNPLAPQGLAIRDLELIKSLKIVKNLCQLGFDDDLHKENYMFRRTKFGPQLVLTDPLSFRTSDPIKLRMINPKQGEMYGIVNK